MGTWDPEQAYAPGPNDDWALRYSMDRLAQSDSPRDRHFSVMLGHLLVHLGHDIPLPDQSQQYEVDEAEANRRRLAIEIEDILLPHDIDLTHSLVVPSDKTLSPGALEHLRHESYPTLRQSLLGDMGGVAVKHDLRMRIQTGRQQLYVPKSFDMHTREAGLHLSSAHVSKLHLDFNPGYIDRVQFRSRDPGVWHAIFEDLLAPAAAGHAINFTLRRSLPSVRIIRAQNGRLLTGQYRYDPGDDNFPPGTESGAAFGDATVTPKQFTGLLARTLDLIPEIPPGRWR